MAKYKNNLKQVTSVLKALADVNRVRIVMALCGGGLCVCQITEHLGLAPSTVSKHLYILRQAGLIDSDKTGRWVHYKLAEGGSDKAAIAILAWAKEVLAADITTKQDRKQLKEIKKMDMEQLCRRMRKVRF